jgi:trimethylamine--corrinoid protein Co-methyltransferase
MKGFTRKFKPLNILSEQEIESIHKSTLHVLDTVGVTFESKRALSLFKKAGCRVDEATSQVRFPPSLVEECLRKCPSSFGITARDNKDSLRFGGNTLHFYNSVGLKTVDIDTFEPRAATMQEQNDGVRVLDALDHLHLSNSYTPYMEIEGAPLETLLLETLVSRLRHTTKVTASGYSNHSDMFAVQMAKEIGVDLLGCVMVGPPLRYYKDACDAAFSYAGAGFPVFITSGVSYGATGPVTVAGSTVTNTAEIIAGIVLVQLIRPGTGVLAVDFSFPMDMQTATPIFGSFNSAMHAAMFGQIWRRYQVPTCVSSSGYCSGKMPDYQTGYEKSFSGLAAALAGVNVVSMHGGIYSELSWHPVQAVLDDDLAGMIGNFLEGATINEDTLALDVIANVGSSPGHYLGTQHTFDFWKSELYTPKSADRTSYDAWLKNGKKTTIDYAKERCEDIIANHKISVPLTAHQDDALQRIMKEAQTYYAKNK